jgi:hypothetical protein
MTKLWYALQRESALAAEHLASGVTALGKANYAQEAYYAQAFFALTIGLERCAKLALLIDHALQHGGKFPGNKELRDYGHDIDVLLDQVNQIAGRLGMSEAENRLPNSNIHKGIIEVLSDFARNVTRYYNLDLVTAAPSVTNRADPLRRWFEVVVNPICDLHYKGKQRKRHDENALLIDAVFSERALVRHHTETGEPLDSLYEASKRTGMTEAMAPYIRLYVMQIIRFVARVLSELGRAAQQAQLQDVPYLSEFFVIFNNGDQYLKTRKSWSIYRP